MKKLRNALHISAFGILENSKKNLRFILIKKSIFGRFFAWIKADKTLLIELIILLTSC